MADKKIIAVVGATGAQGGGLVRAIQADRSGSVRGPGRHPESQSEKARRWPRSAPRLSRPTRTTRRAS